MAYVIPVFILLMVFMHIIKEDKLVKESRLQKSIHKLYAVSEPLILKTLNKMISSSLIRNTRVGRGILKAIAKMLWFLPHGVVVDYEGVENLIRWIEKQGDTHIAIGPCVCKKALGVKEEPYVTDMTIFYGAEIYKEIEPEEYRYLSADEALKLLKEFEKSGLIHEIYACCNSGKWTFVICNCDPRYCVPTKAYLLIREGVYPGPKKAVVDADKCKGLDECGKCMEICPFNAIENRDGKSYVNDNCMGCGLCIERCPSNARRLVWRKGYKSKIIPIKIMYPDFSKS